MDVCISNQMTLMFVLSGLPRVLTELFTLLSSEEDLGAKSIQPAFIKCFMYAGHWGYKSNISIQVYRHICISSYVDIPT